MTPRRISNETPKVKRITDQEAVEGLQWLESLYAEDSPAGVHARCVGGLLRGMSQVYELEHGEAVDGGLTHLEFRRALSWLGVYGAGRDQMGQHARIAADHLGALAEIADPWGSY